MTCCGALASPMRDARGRTLAALAGAGAAGLRAVAAGRPRPCRGAAHAAGAPNGRANGDGAALRPLALTAVEQRFAQQFPGRIGRFDAGGGIWCCARWQRPTRALHPAADCFRGLGYRIEQTQSAQRRRRAAVALLRWPSATANACACASASSMREARASSTRRRGSGPRRSAAVERPVAGHDAGGGAVSARSRSTRAAPVLLFGASVLAVPASCSSRPCWRDRAARARNRRPTNGGPPCTSDRWPRELEHAGLIRWAGAPAGRAAARRPRARTRASAAGSCSAAATTCSAMCAPCRVQLPALGPAPLQFARAHLRASHRRRGPLRRHAHARPSTAHELTLELHGAARPARRRPQARAAADADGHVVQVLGHDLPEAASVQVRRHAGASALQRALARGHVAGQAGAARLRRWRAWAPSACSTCSCRRPAARRPAMCRALAGWLPRALVAAEDARFYEHPGYELDRDARRAGSTTSATARRCAAAAR